MILTRRKALFGVTLSVIASGLPVLAQTKNDFQKAIDAFTGGKKPVDGKVKLELPEIAENGNTVPITFSIETPQTTAAHVQEVLVLADANPLPGVIKFSFQPEISVPEANFRMRMAETQNIIVIAKMNDGTFNIAAKQVKVTIGGCGG